jgi:hypothetical protein
MSGGGETRTITCLCGWGTKSSPRESDGKFKIHLKRCELARKSLGNRPLNLLNQSNGVVNGENGMVISRNGNLVTKPSMPSIILMDGKEVKTSLTTLEVTRLQQQQLKECKE